MGNSNAADQPRGNLSGFGRSAALLQVPEDLSRSHLRSGIQFSSITICIHGRCGDVSAVQSQYSRAGSGLLERPGDSFQLVSGRSFGMR